MHEELRKMLPQIERDVPDMALNAAKFIRAARNLLTENGELCSKLAAKDAENAELRARLASYQKYGLEPCDYAAVKAVEDNAQRCQAELSDAIHYLAKAMAERADLRNELCQQCGKYHMAHKGACDGCRWRATAKQGEEG